MRGAVNTKVSVLSITKERKHEKCQNAVIERFSRGGGGNLKPACREVFSGVTPNKKFAFTLAEVLITLGVIGVVAALTMPTLLKNIAERSNSEAQANLAQKITKSMDLMRADGGLERTYASTDEFVDEFSKYIKITTRCDAAHIANCWPTKTVTTTDGETYDVSKAKTGKNLNLKDNKSDNVGIILADGATLIMTYNPNAGIIGDGDTVTPSFADLPIGFGRTKKFAYTTSVTAPIDFVMDVNGFKGPNSEARNGKQYDIRSFKVAKFSKGCAGVEVSGIGCVYVLPSFDGLTLDDPDIEKYDPGWSTLPSFFTGSPNKWAGAKKACDGLDMSMPDAATLKSILSKAKKENLDIPQLMYWSSTKGSKPFMAKVVYDDEELDNIKSTVMGGTYGICVGK